MKNIFKIIPHFELKWNYKVGRIEKGFEIEIINKLRAMGFRCFHPQDVWLWNKFLDLHIVSPQHKPRELAWIEFKYIKWDTFNIKALRDNQIEDLKLLEDFAEVWIYSVKRNDYKRFYLKDLWKLKSDKWSIKIFN